MNKCDFCLFIYFFSSTFNEFTMACNVVTAKKNNKKNNPPVLKIFTVSPLKSYPPQSYPVCISILKYND